MKSKLVIVGTSQEAQGKYFRFNDNAKGAHIPPKYAYSITQIRKSEYN